MKKKIILTKEHLERMKLPCLYWDAVMDIIPEKECPHKKHIEKYLQSLPKYVDAGIGLILHGEYSRGKSAIASIILKEAAEYGFLGLWVRAGNIFQHIVKDDIYDKNWTMHERMKEVPLLVIDELLIRGDDKFRETCVEDLVRERISEKKASIITTNLTPDKIEGAYPALYAVLREALFPIKIYGHDFRTDKASIIRNDFT